jgi:putative transposase
MKTTKFTEEQMAFSLRQSETGTKVGELRRLKQLEEENRQLKKLVADLSLDKQMLQDVLRKKF